MYKPLNVLWVATLLCLFSNPATAQSTQLTFQQAPLVLTKPVIYIWLGISLLASYLLSIGLTVMLKQSWFPPNAARFGCWFAMMLETLFITFVLFGYFVHYVLPMWLTISLILVMILIGAIIYSQRRRFE